MPDGLFVIRWADQPHQLVGADVPMFADQAELQRVRNWPADPYAQWLSVGVTVRMDLDAYIRLSRWVPSH